MDRVHKDTLTPVYRVSGLQTVGTGTIWSSTERREKRVINGKDIAVATWRSRQDKVKLGPERKESL